MCRQARNIEDDTGAASVHFQGELGDLAGKLRASGRQSRCRIPRAGSLPPELRGHNGQRCH
jgi:hypothetical protein